MGYYELLPKREKLLDDLLSIGVTDDQQREFVVDAVAEILEIWSDYYDTEFDRYGLKEDSGARDALLTIREELMPPVPEEDAEGDAS